MGTVPPGLRLQIVLALAGLMLLAFVPLFSAVASLTHATLGAERDQAARTLVSTIALSLADSPNLVATLERNVGHGGVEALAVWSSDGGLLAHAGEAPWVTSDGRTVRVPVLWRESLTARLRSESDAERGTRLVRLVALYMFMFAVALAVFAYATLTRLIVGPVESLAHAADRVAEGERTLRVPRAGARELAELGRSLQAMTTRLVADEEAMRAKVAELTRTTQRLEETKRHLARSERLASVGRLAAGIAHEIGNPLAALLGFEDLLLDGDLPLETQRDFLVRMKRETERMHTVVRGLLDFARPEKSTGADSLATADVAAVIGDVVALAGPQKLFRNVELAVELDVGPLVVAMSSASLTQVVLNLVLNAGAALEQRMEGRVVLRARGDSQEVRLEVEDNGPGVSAELRDRLFEPFATTKDVGEGTGLGLAVCRGLVEGAGGTIDLDTSYSGGARFCVVVRRCRSRTPHCSAPSP